MNITAAVRSGTLTLALALVACSDKEAKKDAQVAADLAASARAEETATRAALLPATGLWSEEHLMDRLVRTGVLPRAREEAPPAAPWMGKPPISLNAGGGAVYVWIFADSAARKAVTDGLDQETGTPPGTSVPWPMPMQFVINNNLAAVVTGGNVRNQERITLALQAGLPVIP